MLKNGIITKIISDTFLVNYDGMFVDCKIRGKLKNKDYRISVGDKVKIDTEKGTIEEILPRINYLSRPVVANIDIALIVTSLKNPELSLILLDKLLSIITINKIEPVIVFTKLDLGTKNDKKKLKKLSKYYESIGIKVFNNKDVRRLKRYLKGKVVTVCGQTGAGKSTLINKFDKRLNLETNEISKSLGRGKHTTRVVELFSLKNFFIVDTPGFSSIDINNYSEEEIRNSFKEFNNFSCKFKDCWHKNELGCSIKHNNKILPSRYENYLKLIER